MLEKRKYVGLECKKGREGLAASGTSGRRGQ
jgi:hypothetical protein